MSKAKRNRCVFNALLKMCTLFALRNFRRWYALKRWRRRDKTAVVERALSLYPMWLQ